MAIACPYCKHSIGLKNIKPGKYAPKCPKCVRPFHLIVPENPAASHLVRALAATAKVAPRSAPSDATGAFVSTAGAAAAPKEHGQEAFAATAFDPNATGAVAAPPPDAGMTAELPYTADAAPEADATGEFSQEAEGLPPEAAASDPGLDQTVAPESASMVGAKPPLKLGPKQESTAGTLATLGGYQVVKLLGKGGMGAVYLARQVSLDRLVALKVMLPKAAADPAFVARFTREAYAAAQLVHHNVVQIYDIGSDKKTHSFSSFLSSFAGSPGKRRCF